MTSGRRRTSTRGNCSSSRRLRSSVRRRGNSTFASFAVRNYRLYFIGQTVSGAGTWMQNVAIGWLVVDSFHSGPILGAVTATRYAPFVLFGLWGGLVVD